MMHEDSGQVQLPAVTNHINEEGNPSQDKRDSQQDVPNVRVEELNGLYDSIDACYHHRDEHSHKGQPDHHFRTASHQHHIY